MSDQLHHLLLRYRECGHVQAGEILLPSEVALELIDDLERLDVPLWGVDFWRTREGHLIEIPGEWNAVGSSVAELAQDARRMIVEGWPNEAAFVSLVFPGYFLDEA